MTTDGTNRDAGALPFVTHAMGAYPPGEHPAVPAPYPTEVMPTAPVEAPAPEPRRRSWLGALVPVLTVPLMAAAGAAGMWLYLDGGAAPASCTEALDLADELNSQSEEYGLLVQDAFDAVASFDQGAADAVVAEMQVLSEEHDATYAAYETAAESCREAGGAL